MDISRVVITWLGHKPPDINHKLKGDIGFKAGTLRQSCNLPSPKAIGGQSWQTDKQHVPFWIIDCDPPPFP